MFIQDLNYNFYIFIFFDKHQIDYIIFGFKKVK